MGVAGRGGEMIVGLQDRQRDKTGRATEGAMEEANPRNDDFVISH